MIRRLSVVAVLAIAAATSTAQAVELQFDGFYQARMRLFDTLSLNRSLDSAEGLSWGVQHRFWIRPKFLVSDEVAVFSEIRGLDNLYWGSDAWAPFDPVGQDATPMIFSDEFSPPASGEDGRGSLFDISLWRAWGEVHTKIGTFKFGRMPLHWGMGVWQNDGLAANTEYGDSADRLMWEHVISDIYLRAAFDINTEGFINQTDDTTSYNVSAAYRTERVEGGLNAQYRRNSDFNLFTVDLSFNAELGILDVSTEIIGQFGGGDLPGGLNGVKVLAFGGVLDAGINLDKTRLSVQGGFATGDGDTTNNEFKTFSFDRDYNVGLFMFEQTMPVLSAVTPTEGDVQGRDFGFAQTGTSVSNALYLRPMVSREIVRGLWVDGQFLAARAAKVPEALKLQERNSYGYEIDATVRYNGIQHFEVGATVGVFIPGNYYRNFELDGVSGFDQVAVGGQLLTRIAF